MYISHHYTLTQLNPLFLSPLPSIQCPELPEQFSLPSRSQMPTPSASPVGSPWQPGSRRGWSPGSGLFGTASKFSVHMSRFTPQSGRRDGGSAKRRKLE